MNRRTREYPTQSLWNARSQHDWTVAGTHRAAGCTLVLGLCILIVMGAGCGARKAGQWRGRLSHSVEDAGEAHAAAETKVPALPRSGTGLVRHHAVAKSKPTDELLQMTSMDVAQPRIQRASQRSRRARRRRRSRRQNLSPRRLHRPLATWICPCSRTGQGR